jgi:alginate O-acetyltransferase complex protein AlgI
LSFVTVEFAIFFAVVVPIYFVTPHRLRWVLLLGASYVFYGFWNVNYLPLIIFSTLVDYIVGLALDRTPAEQSRRRLSLLFTSITMNLGLLFTFKYFNFFSDSFGALYRLVDPTYDPVVLNVLLPVGISFYTFQSMAYAIDVYRGKMVAERHLGIFATYIVFFPQLVAGPIERAQNMLPQFRREMPFDVEKIVSGLQLVLWGVFMKVVIADHLALYVNNVYGDIYGYSGPAVTLASFFFHVQIYCDFAAYSKIARGIARMMGYELMVNFRQPFLAKSHTEIWQRWHISLLTWFQDYIFFPLGGSRRRIPRVIFNIMVVYLVSGLWHGAGWNFVIWGIASGLFVVVELMMRVRKVTFIPKQWPKNVRKPLQIILTVFTFQILCLFFRSPDLGTLWYGITHLYTLRPGFDIFHAAQDIVLSPQMEVFTMLLSIVLLLTVDWLHEKYEIIGNLHKVRPVVRYAALYGTGTLLIVFIFNYAATAAPDFIYFQF